MDGLNSQDLNISGLSQQRTDQGSPISSKTSKAKGELSHNRSKICVAVNGSEAIQSPLDTRPFLVTGFSVVPKGTGKYYGFTIDGNRRFLLGSFLVTHNTILGAYLASKAGLLTIVLAHRKTLLGQWQNTFHKVTDAQTWIVGNEPMPARFNVIICLDKRVKKLGDDLVKRVGMLIIDEAHVFCTPDHVDDLLRFQPRYIIAETATLKRDDDMDRMITALCGLQQISREMTKEFYVYKLATGIAGQRESRKGGQGVNWNVLMSSLTSNPHRNQLIVDVVAKNPDRKILVLTGLVKHVKTLYQMLKEKGESVDYMCGNKKMYADSRVLIGTISKIGTGFDEESFCRDYGGKRIDLAILVQSVAKSALLEQSVGRAFRAHLPNIIHFVDADPTIERHWKRVARPWYKSRGGTIKEICA
jgi:hypothetical protein